MKRTLSTTLPLALLPLAALACVPPAPPTTEAAGSSTAAPPAASSSTTPAKPATSDELRALARSDNAFGLDLYARIRSKKGNLAVSPFSIATALTMTWAGAKGETAAQMARVLHLDAPADRALDAAGSLVLSYGAPDQKVTVRVANRLFGDKTYAFEQPFLARLAAGFGAPLEPLDFKGDAEPSRLRVNGWVAHETENRIQDLIPEGGVDATTRLVLTNAVYFRGDWAVPFEKDATFPAPFSLDRMAKKDVPTMHERGSFRYAATDGIQVVELPYQNGALAMTFVVPDAIDGLDAVEARLTPAVYERWIGAASPTEVAISLPKLEIAPASALSLSDTLSGMGMPLAFDGARADFTGIANPATAADRLSIDRVFHKAFVKVDEKGTEAAAATAVSVGITGVAPERVPPKVFNADHPFLYLLRDTRTGLVLFMGRVADPASK